MTAHRLLILGGTTEGAALARGAVGRFGDELRVTTSLAGRTARPVPLPGQIRIGGFGGAAGLATYLAEQRIDCLIDATHPFAGTISSHAARAASLAHVPLLVLRRPGADRHRCLLRARCGSQGIR